MVSQSEDGLEPARPRFLFGEPEEAAFRDPLEGAHALVDWSRGWRMGLRAQTRRALRLTIPVPANANNREDEGHKVALVLPGVWERGEVLEPWARALRALGWDVRTVPDLDLQIGSLKELTQRLEDFLQDQSLHDVLIVAHSKGGLVAKQAMVGSQGWRISQLIACGTPFDGAPIANLTAPQLKMRSLVPWDPEIQALADNHEPNRRIVAIQAQWDQNVPADPVLPGATVITVAVEGHNALITAPEVIALIAYFAGSGH